MTISPFGWNDNAPPYLSAENLEAMLQAAGAYADAKTSSLLPTPIVTGSRGGSSGGAAPTDTTLVPHPDGAGGWSWGAGGGGASYNGFGSTFINVKDAPYSAHGDNTTDDTAAVQAAIDACIAAGGGTVYFPPGKYLISASLRTSPSAGTGSFCAQITLNNPATVPSATPNTPMIIVQLLGERPIGWTDTDGERALSGGSYLVSNSAGAAYSAHSALPAMLGGPENTNNGYFTNLGVVVRNLGAILPTNPNLAAFNFMGLMHSYEDEVYISTQDQSTDFATEPTNNIGIGLAKPGNSNWGDNAIGKISIEGFFEGLRAGEHTNATGDIWLSSCHIGLGWSGMFHASAFGRIEFDGCTTLMAFNNYSGGGGQTAVMSFGQVDIEDKITPAWKVPVNHIWDGNTLLTALIPFHRVVQGSGVTTGPLNIVGGPNIRTFCLDTVAADDVWRHEITAPWLGISAKVGTWAPFGGSTLQTPAQLYNSSAAQNDSISYDLYLSRGTWTFDSLLTSNPDHGIATVELDGVSVGTVDLYAGSGGIVSGKITGITVGNSGKHRITLIAATKNASSSGYTLGVQQLALARTA